MPQIRRSVLATSASLLTAAVFVVAPPAAQADSAGAIRFDFHYCTDDHRFCLDGTTLENIVTARNGNSVLTYHSQYSSTFSGFGCNGQTQQKDMTTYLLKPDATGAYHVTNNGQTTRQCQDGTSTTCKTMFVFTIADDQVRLNKATADCTEATAGAATT